LHSFRAAALVRAENPAPREGRHACIVRSNSAHTHAHVLALHHHDGAGCIEVLDKRVGDLIGEPLLQLWAAREHFYRPREL
jgi:hypothetical protein